MPWAYDDSSSIQKQIRIATDSSSHAFADPIGWDYPNTYHIIVVGNDISKYASYSWLIVYLSILSINEIEPLS